MHTQAYQAGRRDGATHTPATSLQHSWAHHLAQRDRHERASKLYAYHAGMADALHSRMVARGKQSPLAIADHGAFTRPAVVRTTVTNDKFTVIRRAHDGYAEKQIALHNKRLIEGEKPEPELIEYSRDVVPLADRTSQLTVVTLTTKGTSARTNQARRAATLREAEMLAAHIKDDARGKLSAASPKLGNATPSNK